MNGKYYVLEDVANAKKVVKTFIKIKEIKI
jgi:CxxC motif-containing protein